jgi:hypothetical protein
VADRDRIALTVDAASANALGNMTDEERSELNDLATRLTASPSAGDGKSWQSTRESLRHMATSRGTCRSRSSPATGRSIRPVSFTTRSGAGARQCVSTWASTTRQRSSAC